MSKKEESGLNYPIKIPMPQDGYVNGLYEPPSMLVETKQPHGGDRRLSCIIMMHGFPGEDMNTHNALFPLLATRVAPHGFATMRFDFRGCGGSSGMSKDFTLNKGLSDLRKTMDWLRNQYKFTQFILVSSGLSCHIALQAFMPNLVTALVMICPNINPLASDLSWMKGVHEDHQAQKQGFVERDGIKYGLALINEVNILNVTPLLESVTCPTSVQYGTKDSQAPAGQIELLKDYMINSRLDMGVFHEGTHGLEDKAMRQTMLLNMEQFLKKIP